MHNAPAIHPSQFPARVTTDGWSLNGILMRGKRFLPISRVSCSSPSLTAEINKFEDDGVPLVIEGFHTRQKWLRREFTPEWCLAHCAEDIDVRNVYDWSDKTMPLADFFTQSRAAPKFANASEKERLYGKDAVCPDLWSNWLSRGGVIPFPLGPDHPDNLLLSRVETLMCYFGIGDTFTPCHKDLCASTGHNLMCYTEDDGSSFWFMTRSSDAPVVSQYFQILNQELDHETHIITIDQLANAPFDVYVSEQKLGDLVLVPPRSCHQVVNYGGITIKMSWSRMTLQGLEVAYYHELPIYRRVCREETYRIKSTIYHALCQGLSKLARIRRDIHSRSLLPDNKSDLERNARVLLRLFDDILVEEYSPAHSTMHCLLNPSPSPTMSISRDNDLNEDVQLTCDFCGADIFQSFFECLHCVPSVSPMGSQVEHGDGFAICAGCYVEGRSCQCGRMEPIQREHFDKLSYRRDKAAELISNIHAAVPSLDLDYLSSDSGVGMFRAACILHSARQAKRKAKGCESNIRPTADHLMPLFSGLSCKKCHQTKCFAHTLMFCKLHASDALLIEASDSSHEKYHHYHRTSSDQYNKGRETFLQCQKRGTKPDSSQQRVFMALQYSTCKPIVNSAFISLGWYDQILPSTGDSPPEIFGVKVPE